MQERKLREHCRPFVREGNCSKVTLRFYTKIKETHVFESNDRRMASRFLIVCGAGGQQTSLPAAKKFPWELNDNIFLLVHVMNEFSINFYEILRWAAFRACMGREHFGDIARKLYQNP